MYKVMVYINKLHVALVDMILYAYIVSILCIYYYIY